MDRVARRTGWSTGDRAQVAPGAPPSLADAGRMPRKLDRDLSGRTRKPTGWRAYRDA